MGSNPIPADVNNGLDAFFLLDTIAYVPVKGIGSYSRLGIPPNI